MFSIDLAMALVAASLLGLLCILPFTGYPPDVRARLLIRVLLILGSCLLLFGSMVLLYRLWSRKIREVALKCPSCHKFLMGEAGQVAVETGRCSHCGAPVYDQ